MRSATVEETEKQKKVKGRTEWTIECTTLDVFIEREVRLALESPKVCSAYNGFVRRYRQYMCLCQLGACSSHLTAGH